MTRKKRRREYVLRVGRELLSHRGLAWAGGSEKRVKETHEDDLKGKNGHTVRGILGRNSSEKEGHLAQHKEGFRGERIGNGRQER